MAMDSPRARARERERVRRSSAGRRVAVWILRLAVLAVVFLAGLAIGRAVEQAPEPGGTQTIVRTLEPLTVEPRERTVTVTTGGG
jgi:cell division septal protein FtsQ